MLKSIKKNLKHKHEAKAEEILKKGLKLLNAKLNKQATLLFQNAFKLNPEFVAQRLKKEFRHFREIQYHDAALAVGITLIKSRQKDYQLINEVGNCARRAKNHKQANILYRLALRIKKDYQPGFYNLAASLAKVDRFDFDVKRSLETVSEIKWFVLPEYFDDPDFEKTIIASFLKEIKETKRKQVDNLQIEIGLKEAENHLHEVKALSIKLKLLTKKINQITYDDYVNFSQALLRRNFDNQSPDWKKVRSRNIYNYGIYLLNKRIPAVALECFQTVKESGVDFKYTDMLIALANAASGDLKSAIKLLVDNLGNEQHNRLFNINLGLLYKKAGNRLLAAKYLLLGAKLLEKSNGLFHLSELLTIAEEKMSQGSFKQALALFQVAASEVDDLNIWLKIGHIYVYQKLYDQAAKAFREMLRISPDSEEAHKQLRDLHDTYRNRAESSFHKAKYQASALLFEKALRIQRLPDTLKLAIAAYRVLNNFEKTQALSQEYEEIKRQEKEVENENKRQEHIRLGRQYIKQNSYTLGIESLELAFRMKLDRDVFVTLASIFKALKRKDDMADLLNRWNKMIEYEEKLKRCRKEEQYRLAAG